MLCGKPLSMRSQDVRDLIAVRERTGRRIEEGFAYRNRPQWDHFMRLRDSQAIGRVAWSPTTRCDASMRISLGASPDISQVSRCMGLRR